ncbi:MAG TPA: RNA polymerase sigma factor [Polyangiaceae bacterium]|nr:RNA polymerase sigma factor [Polyangiaceae bacterium]
MSGRLLRLITGSKEAPGIGSVPPRDDLLDLARAVEQGDAAALRTFLGTIIPHLLRVARRVLGPTHPYLEDVAHDAAYLVIQKLPEFRGEGTVLGFARRVTLLTAMNVRRRDRTQKRARQRDSTDPDTLEGAFTSPEDQLAVEGALPVLRTLMDELPDAQAEAFALHVVLGYTVLEIAELSAVPVDTVRSRLRAAKRALRTKALAHPALRELAEGGT